MFAVVLISYPAKLMFAVVLISYPAKCMLCCYSDTLSGKCVFAVTLIVYPYMHTDTHKLVNNNWTSMTSSHGQLTIVTYQRQMDIYPVSCFL